MTASVPNISLNSVSLVGAFVVILFAQRSFGSSSNHAPFCPLKMSFDNFEQASVCHFCLTVGLRVSWRRVVVLDS